MILAGRRGFALLYILLLSVVIIMIVSALLTLSKGHIQQSRQGIDHTRALLAAESGLAAVMSEMERDPGWTAGFDNKPLPEGGGTYTAHFASPSVAGKDDCINNLLSAVAVDSYHGSATVPAKSALLVVTGRAGTSFKTIEAQVVFGSSLPTSLALAASGRVSLKGNVRITGVESLLNPNPVPVTLHTNDEGAGVKFSYSPKTSGDSLVVDGDITSSSSSPTNTAIQLASPATVSSKQSQVAPKALPEINIEAMIADQSGSPGPTIPTSPTNMSFSGNNYYPGDVTINGDVTLTSNARLLVGGNLTINGSVKGEGALIVGGNTKLHGTAQVTGNSADYISVVSRGHVVLSGFQGQSYMDSLVSSDPTAAEYWGDTKWALGQIQGYIDSHSSLSLPALSDQMNADDVLIDSWMSVLANHVRTPPMDGARQRHGNTSQYFQGRFSTATPNSTEAFLNQRFQQLDDVFRVCYYDRDGNSPRYQNQQLLDNYVDYDPALDGGLFDSVESWGNIETADQQRLFQEINQTVERFDYDRLGSADFKGYVYTSGALIVKDDMNLQGAVVVNGRRNIGSIMVDGVSYAPGELALLDDSKLTYVQEMFRDGVQNLAGAGKLDVKRWVSR